MQRRCLTARLLQRWAGSATATATSTCWTSASTSSMYSTITSPSSSLHRAAVPIAHRRRHAIPRAAASSSSSTAAAAAGSASSARRERGDVRGGASGTARRRRVPPASAPAPKSWSELPLRNEMLVALEEDMQLVAPTEVQCVAIPRLIGAARGASVSSLPQQSLMRGKVNTHTHTYTQRTLMLTSASSSRCSFSVSRVYVSVRQMGATR